MYSRKDSHSRKGDATPPPKCALFQPNNKTVCWYFIPHRFYCKSCVFIFSFTQSKYCFYQPLKEWSDILLFFFFWGHLAVSLTFWIFSVFKVSITLKIYTFFEFFLDFRDLPKFSRFLKFSKCSKFLSLEA